MRLAEISKDEFHQRLVNPMRTKLLNQIKEYKKEVEDDYDFTVSYEERELGGDPCFILEATPNAPVDQDDVQKVLTAYYALFVVNHFSPYKKYASLL